MVSSPKINPGETSPLRQSQETSGLLASPCFLTSFLHFRLKNGSKRRIALGSPSTLHPFFQTSIMTPSHYPIQEEQPRGLSREQMDEKWNSQWKKRDITLFKCKYTACVLSSSTIISKRVVYTVRMLNYAIQIFIVTLLHYIKLVHT